MGSCNCVTSVEEPAVPISDLPHKQDQEIIENELIEITFSQVDQVIQALVRSYFARKSFKRKKKLSPVSTSAQIDLRQYLSENLLKVLSEKPEFDYLADGELAEQDNKIFIGVNKQNNSSEGHLITQDSYYKGTVKNFLYHGKGTLVKDNGDFYVGLFMNGLFHGQGDYVSPNQNFRYSGSWHNGEHSGRGTEFFPDGSVCTAHFNKGHKNGEGLINWKDGSRYSGSFMNDHFEGDGKYIWKDGKSYEGSWKDGFMEGKGKFYWPDGRLYEGDFAKSLKEGFGVFTWANGKKYEGMWKAGKQHGIGTLYEPGKKTKKGEWKAGKRIRWVDS